MILLFSLDLLCWAIRCVEGEKSLWCASVGVLSGT